MKKITRRRLLRNGAYLGAAASTFSPLSYATGSPKTSWTRRKAAVIGSGFGGSVATLRLANAGISTALIERGKHWVYQGEGSYPTLSGGFSPGFFWSNPTAAAPGSIGMMESFSGGTIPASCGAGLGGGSLVYGGVLLQPRREAFEQILPDISYDAMDAEYYPRVLSRVSGGAIPDDILNSPNYAAMRVFIDNASAAGLETVRSEVGFDWNIIRNEVEGRINPYASVGEYVFGCNSGAKKTLDRNYIAEANATGKVDIFTQHNVTTITRRGRNGPFFIHCDVISDEGEILSTHIVVCKYLFMAAGSLNTTKLLLKVKALGDLPSINDGVGEAWGTNGDELMGRVGVSAPLGPAQGGPPAIAAYDIENPIKLTGFMHSPTNSIGPTGQLQMGMSIPDQLGSMTYDVATDRGIINWSPEANAQSHEAILYSMEKVSSVSGGSVIDQSSRGTWHPLGGATMGVATSNMGELLGTPNLFVIDGALLPGSAGVANPSLTVAANAERVMEKLLRKRIR